jgi:N-methylhydantoinase A/oxoprolinase/acetone carboxylase beta subunit
MRGASYLAGIDLVKQEISGKNIIVVDVGGTTTDVGVLLPSGFPRQAAAFIKGSSNSSEIIRNFLTVFCSCWSKDKVLPLLYILRGMILIVFLSFSMPDVYSIGLGGGSRVRLAESGLVTVGPDSVGHQVSTYIVYSS